MPRPQKTSDRGVAEGYRSGLEEKIAAQLEALGCMAVYEAHKLSYTKPEKTHRYTPDFFLPNGLVIETKGRFVTADRQKHLHIKACHPGLEVRFIFSNPSARIGKQSQTTYAMWCERHGFAYAKATVPPSWVTEALPPAAIAAARRAFGAQD